METVHDSRTLVEACVTDVDQAVRCASAGAGRLELCRDLETGGLTPSAGMVADVCAAVDIPVFAMVRPRPGDFVHDGEEIDRMERDILAMTAGGASGIVLGVLRPDGRVDEDAVARLVDTARPLAVTFHRAFDRVPDPIEALEAVLRTGAARILTAGRRDTALEGCGEIADLVLHAANRLAIMPGGRVRADHARQLVKATGAAELHARAEAVPALVRALRSD